MNLDFNKINQDLNLSFKNLDLLKEALTHRSFLNENKDWPVPHNERLEFLGDSILGFVVADELLKEFPELPEGQLTVLRAALVNSDSLLEVAKELKIENYILASKGELKDLHNSRSYILSNAIEALIGALYLDNGLESSREFIKKYILPKTKTILATASYKDAKSFFQEKSQEILGITPIYKTLRSWGPDHNKEFEVGVYLNEELIAKGHGHSKQEAETEAAQNALEIKDWH
ncbi:MAG: ribonuclease III [Parcubacteria group bacterium]|nr:ribonuclease III [Parcubacteria group bacterium]